MYLFTNLRTILLISPSSSISFFFLLEALDSLKMSLLIWLQTRSLLHNYESSSFLSSLFCTVVRMHDVQRFFAKSTMYILIATTVLGQRDLYRPAPAPQAQERAYIDNQGSKAYDYNDYEDYSPGQAAPAASATTGERGRLPPKQTGPSLNTFAYQTDCKSRERTLPHEKYCDHFYQLNGCSGSDDQAILRSCPNGLVYTGTGRNGLIGVCDYPHRSECSGQERHSK